MAQQTGESERPPLARGLAQLDDNRGWVWRTSPLRPVRLERFLLLIVALGLVWRGVRFVLGFPVWGDEAFVAINFLQRDYWGMIDPLIYGQIVPLGFMWGTLAITKLLGVNEWSLRLLSVVAGCLAVPLFWRFAAQNLSRRQTFIAVGVFAMAYYTVRHAVEVKPYGLDLLVCLTLNVLAWNAWQRPDSWGRWLALAAFGALSVWLSYPVAFTGGAVGLLLLCLVFRERFRPTPTAGAALFALAFGASFVWMYKVYAGPHAAYASKLIISEMWTPTFVPWREPWKIPGWLFLMLAGNMTAYPIGGKAPGSIVTLALIVIGAMRLWREGKRPLLLLLLSPLAFAFVAASLRLYPFGGSARIAQYIAPAFCLLAGVGAVDLLERFLAGPRRIVAMRLVGVFLVGVAIVGVIRDFREPYKSEDAFRAREAVRTLAAESSAQDRWVVFNAVEPVPYAPWLGDWYGAGAQFVFDTLRFHPGGLEWAPPPDSVTRRDNQTIWLLAFRAVKDRVVFPEEQFAAYRDALRERLGPATEHRTFFLRESKGRIESIDAYRFSNGTAP